LCSLHVTLKSLFACSNILSRLLFNHHRYYPTNNLLHSCRRLEFTYKAMSSNQSNVASNTHGSLTLTASQAGPTTLRLRAEAEPSERRRIQWAEDVIDNEGMGKKSSKGA